MTSLGVGPGLPLIPSSSSRVVPLRMHGVELVSDHGGLPSEAQEGEAQGGRGSGFKAYSGLDLLHDSW